MKLIKTNNISFLQKESIYKLWNNEYPDTITYHSISQLDDYLDKLSCVFHYFLMEDEIVIGWAFTFIRDDEKWFAIIVDNDFQGKGMGRVILNYLKECNPALNGWVVDRNSYLKSDGAAYKVPLHFYLKNGFNLVENVRLDIPQMKAVKIRWSNQ